MKIYQAPMKCTPATDIHAKTGYPPGKIVCAGWDLEQNRPSVHILADYENPELQYLVALGPWQAPPGGSEHVISWSGIVPVLVSGGIIPNELTFHVWSIPAPERS